MKYLSVCSGIEAATVAWHDLGWSPVAFSEIEAFPSAVLREHYPDVPNWGDMTKFQEWPDAAVDVLVGGTPCQSFSVAGLRKGLADPRGNLALTYLAIADKYRPEWLVWENVPGVLSSNGGRDFGAFLGGLGELGYGWAYRVLDAQYFGVAQRRRRVFVVGCLGSWQRAAAVLFERHSLSGYPAPRREARESIAGGIGGGPEGGRVAGAVTSKCAKGSGGQAGDECYNMVAHTLRAQQGSEDGTGRGVPVVPAQPYTLAIRGRADSYDLEFRQDGLANALLTPNGGRAGIGVGAVAHAFDARQSDVVQYGDMTGPLDTDGQSMGVLQPIAMQNNLIGRTEGGPCGVGVSGEGVMFTLTKQDVHGVALLGGIDYQHVGVMTPVVPVAFSWQSALNPGLMSEDISPTLIKNQTQAVALIGGIDYQHNGHTAEEPTGPLLKGSPTGGGSPLPAVAFEPGSIARHAGPAGESHLAPTLRKEMGDNQPAVRVGMSVRRLTPRECERLQGFPDDYTAIPYRGKPAADGPRYKALGNSMAVPVMRWIGQRLQAVADIMTEPMP